VSFVAGWRFASFRRAVATLTSVLGDFDAAEEAVQEA
jgi:predicted RNA polymerase sigma factor